MKLNYMLILEKISKDQGLGLQWNQIPLIINTDLTTYIHAFITYEDDDFLSIIVSDENGAEFAKILNKSTVLCIEILYSQMLEMPKDSKEEGMYG